MMIGRLLPKRCRQWIRSRLAQLQTANDIRGDGLRYLKHSAPREGAFPGLTPVQVEAQVTRDYHRVEKGLALPEPKRPFGGPLQDRLSALLPIADQNAYWNEAGRSAVDGLVDWNERSLHSDTLSPKKAPRAPFGTGGPEQFFRSRQSVRNFAPEQVNEEIVQQALALALHSPSVCNRQPWRMRLYRGDEVAVALSHQNGNRGFRNTVPHVALITVGLGYFNGSGERNQAWIEGGIFSANFVLALHALGVDSCMLNLSLPQSALRTLRADLQLDSGEVPIMMVAFGYAADDTRVARSPRRREEDVVRYNTLDRRGEVATNQEAGVTDA